MSSRRASNSGAVTAEFAAVFPALVLTVGLLFSSVQVAILQIELQRLAGMAARELARGGNLENLGNPRPGFTVTHFNQGSLICVEVRNEFPELTEQACALTHGN